MTLAALRPLAGQLLWDVGAGAGSVSIEWCLRHPANRVLAIETRPERAERIRRNAETLGVPDRVAFTASALVLLALWLTPASVTTPAGMARGPEMFFDSFARRAFGRMPEPEGREADAHRRVRIGLALGGGAARGWAHIGVLRVLDRAGLKPDVIAGCSIGGVVGGCYAAGKLDQLESFARTLTKRRIIGLRDPARIWIVDAS